jgi:hypothetical protein
LQIREQNLGLKLLLLAYQEASFMPTKRRVIIFLIVLAVLLLVRHAAADEPQRMQWRGPDAADSEAIEHAVYILMGGGIVFGAFVSGGRAIANKRRTKRDGYFTGDLTMISIDDHEPTDRESK